MNKNLIFIAAGLAVATVLGIILYSSLKTDGTKMSEPNDKAKKILDETKE